MKMSSGAGCFLWLSSVSLCPVVEGTYRFFMVFQLRYDAFSEDVAFKQVYNKRLEYIRISLANPCPRADYGNYVGSAHSDIATYELQLQHAFHIGCGVFG